MKEMNGRSIRQGQFHCKLISVLKGKEIETNASDHALAYDMNIDQTNLTVTSLCNSS